VAEIYDYLERNNLLNSNGEVIARTKIEIEIIMSFLKNPKSYQYIYFYSKYSEYFFSRFFLDQIECKSIFKYCRV
jgi:hypothetical protein